MRVLKVSLLSVLLTVLLCFGARAQESFSSIPAGDHTERSTPQASPAPASFDDVMDRVIQREHLFLAQMRHMRPMVETYIQDYKTDSSGKNEPTKDQYFLGRLDMSDGP